MVVDRSGFPSGIREDDRVEGFDLAGIQRMTDDWTPAPSERTRIGRGASVTMSGSV